MEIRKTIDVGNSKHDAQTGLIKSCKLVIRSSLDGTQIIKYYSISEAARKKDELDVRVISCVCKRANKTYKNYIWMFENSDN